MTNSELTNWLDKLKEAWETKNPKLASDICEENLLWYETPFNEPLKTKQEVFDEWQSVLDHKDINLKYKILISDDKFGIAQFSASFTRISSDIHVSMEGIFQVSLNENGRCIEFHQWYNSK